jgi:hypothetical protein
MASSPFFLDPGSLIDLAGAGIAKAFGLNKPADLKFTDPAVLEAAVESLHEKHPDWNVDDVKRYIQVLATYFPHALQSPAVTESLVGQFISYGGIDPNTLKTLVGTEKTIADVELKPNPNAKSGLSSMLWGNPGRTYFLSPIYRS